MRLHVNTRLYRRLLLGILVTLSVTAYAVIVNAQQHTTRKLFQSIVKDNTQQTSTSTSFECKSFKTQAHGKPGRKHTVRLSWKPSVSLSTPPARGDGYNVYRVDPDGSCLRLNAVPITGTAYEDVYVDLGNNYRYAVKAIKHNIESDPSKPVDASIPSK